MPIEIRTLGRQETGRALAIARALPDSFTPEAFTEIEAALAAG